MNVVCVSTMYILTLLQSLWMNRLKVAKRADKVVFYCGDA